MRAWDFYTSNEVKPKGWLYRQLKIQAEGLCGNLDKVWPDIRDSAWIGGDKEGWERVPYWLDGFIPLAYLLESEDMIARAKKYIDAILASQRADGWICPCEDEKRSEYDTWAVLLITKVLTVYYDCSRDDRIPYAVYRVLKNYYTMLKSGEIKLFDWGKSRWFEGLIAIAFTYERYREDWLPELAGILRDQGADYCAFVDLWKRPLNHWAHERHIVNLAMMLKYEAVSCDLLGRKYTDRAEYLHDILNRYNGTAVGLFTGDECLSGLSPIQGTEFCAVVEQMYSYEWLYAYTGDAKWLERLELLAFNALPATASDDMWTHQYVQMSNQIACERFLGRSLFRTNGGEAHLFGLEPNFGCCTANFGQGWPKFVLASFFRRGNTVMNGIPVPSELKTADQHIVLETDYPFENRLSYTVRANSAFTFKIRIPSFAKNVKIDGIAATGEEAVFEFQRGDSVKIVITFDTEPFFKERPYGLRTAQCGSLCFSVPIRYEKKMREYESYGVERKFPYCDYEYLPLSDWNYAYCNRVPVLEKREVSDVPFSSERPPVVLKATVKKIPWELEEGFDSVCAKLPSSTAPISDREEILLYPYGCAKLRMTELPFVADGDGENRS